MEQDQSLAVTLVAPLRDLLVLFAAAVGAGEVRVDPTVVVGEDHGAGRGVEDSFEFDKGLEIERGSELVGQRASEMTARWRVKNKPDRRQKCCSWDCQMLRRWR